MKTAQQLNKFALFAQELKRNGYSPDEVIAELEKRGSSLQEVVGVFQYGADKVAETQRLSEQFVKPSEMDEQEYWESRLSSLSDEDKQKMQKDPEYFQRFVQANERKSPLVEGAKAGARAAMTQALDTADMLTGGALGWLDKKIGSPAQLEANKQWLKQELSDAGGVLGGIGKTAQFTGKFAGAGASPVARALTPSIAKAPVGSKLLDRALNYLQRTAVAGAGGSLYGGLTAGFQSDFDKEAMKRGATIGGAVAGLAPTVESAISLGAKAVQAPINAAKKYVPNVLRRFGFAETPETIATNVAETFGGRPLAEETGVAVREAGESINAALKAKQSAMYNKASELAGNPQILMTKKGSELGKAIAEISKNTTKSGKKELGKIWAEIGHTKKNAPNYEALKTLKSSLSEKSASATGTLNKSQWKTLQKAVEKDIERGVGSEAYSALKEADTYFAKQLNDPNSVASALDKVLKSGSDSVVGNRVISSATGKAWKASDLNRIVESAEQFGKAEPIKESIRRNITTRAQFNRMSPDQKAMIYGKTLPQAEKIFNSDLATKLEDSLGGVGRFVGKAQKANIQQFTRPALTLRTVLGGM
jgi:hypothetical protein